MGGRGSADADIWTLSRSGFEVREGCREDTHARTSAICRQLRCAFPVFQERGGDWNDTLEKTRVMWGELSLTPEYFSPISLPDFPSIMPILPTKSVNYK